MSFQSFDLIPETKDKNAFSMLTNQVSDEGYLKFLTQKNGGYFFSNCLHIFGVSSQFPFHDLEYINKVVENEFQTIVEGLFFFGEDVFGNLFGYSTQSIIYLDIESGEKEEVAHTFLEWIQVIMNDKDFYFAPSIVNALPAGTSLPQA